VFVPAIDLTTSERILQLCQQYPDYLYSMVGLHPEEVKANWRDVLGQIKALLPQGNNPGPLSLPTGEGQGGASIAIGEVGLDFYWSREFEEEQLLAFEEQVRWSVETRLPLMIHCRKAQNEMVKILRRYEKDLPGGVFHCFTGNQIEARELLTFDRFVLGIGGVLTFKKSHLPEDLPAAVPLERIVLETDCPYMAPVPHRGKRNEPAFVALVMQRLADAYAVTPEQVERQTNDNVKRVFGI
jgi:TatD DNase family protein